MQLKWTEADPQTSEGEHYHVHYLVDQHSEQCLATIADPRNGHILYETDIKIRGVDRSFVTLSAAKDYCEFTAMQANLEDAAEINKQVGNFIVPSLFCRVKSRVKR